MPKLSWGSIDAATFEDLCGDTIRACLSPERRGTYAKTSMEYRRDFQTDGRIDSGGLPYLGLDSPVFFSYKWSEPGKDTASASQAIEQAFVAGDRLERLAGRNPKSVALFSNHDLTPEAQERIRKRVAGRFAICFQGKKELEQHFREHPHLLWRYFSQSWAVESYHSSDAAGLQEALLDDPLAENIPVERLRHPALENLNLQRETHFRITGKPGAGKSVALWQILTSLPETEVILLRTLDSQQTWEHLREILLQPNPRLVLVVDDLHRQVAAHQGAGVLANLCESARKLGPDVHVLVSYRTTNRRQVEEMIEPSTWRNWGFVELRLDDPPRDFIAKIVSLTCDSLDIRADADILRGFTEGIVEWENTPGCAVSSLLPYKGSHLKEGFFPVNLKDREDSIWHEAFKALVRAERSSEIDVLRSVSALRESGSRRNPTETVCEVFTTVAGRGVGEFEQAVQNLHAEGWLKYRDGFVSGHDTQVTADVVELVLEGQPTSWIEKYRCLLEEGRFEALAAKRVQCLCSLSHLYWTIGRADIAERLNSQALVAEPANTRALCNRGVCRVRLRRQQEGIADLYEAVRLAPTEVGPFEKLFFNLVRLNRKEEARQLLDQRVKEPSSSPEMLRFASFACASTGDKKQQLECTQRLWKLEKNATATALFADALRFAGRSQRAFRFLKAALSRWPDSGLLHVMACEHYRMAGKTSEAVEHGETAARLSPNHADAHVVLAWALIGDGRIPDAERAIAKARRIVPNDPVVLAIDGMIHAEKRETDQAMAALTVAIENYERIPEQILSNAYLALGDSLILSDKPKEADGAFALAHKYGVPLPFCRVHKAEALQAVKHYEEAIREFKRASKSSDMASRALRGLSEVYSETGNHHRAANALRKVLRLHPKHPVAHSELITELFHMRKFKSALAWARRQVQICPSRPESHRNLGLSLRYLGRHQEAVIAFDSAIKLDAEHYTSIFNKAESLAALERWNEAVACYQRVRDLNPKWLGANGLTGLAVCLGRAGQLDAALRVFDEAVAFAPNSATVWHNRGYTLAKMGNHAGAIESFDRAASLDPGLKQAWLEKARILTGTGACESAAASLDRAFVFEPPDELSKQVSNNPDDNQLADLVHAARLGDELLAAAPDSISVLSVCAKLRYCTGWLPTVAELCDRILSKLPNYADALVLKARALNRLGQMSGDKQVIAEIREKALAACEHAVATLPDHQEARLQKVVALAHMDRSQEASDAFEKARLMSGASVDDWAMAGMALGVAGHHAMALHAFEEALKGNARSVTALRGRASALTDLGRLPEARDSIDAAIKLNRKDNRLFLQRGQLRFHQGDLPGASADFAQALKLHEKSAEAHERLGLTLRDSKKAEIHFRRALEIDPERPVFLRELGVFEANAGRVDAAVEKLRKAIALSPKDVRARGGLATVLANTGRKEEAKIEYETALALFPDPHLCHQYARLLSEMGDTEKAEHYHKKAVEVFGDNVRGQKVMIALLCKAGPAEGALYHLRKLTQLEPTNPEHHAGCANLCSQKGLVEEAENHYETALKLQEAAFKVHADYAAHLAKVDKMNSAALHFWRAWELRTQFAGGEPQALAQLVVVASAIRDVGLMVIALSEALPKVRGTDDDLYKQFDMNAAELGHYLETKASGESENAKARSALLCFAGILSSARGDALEARKKFRMASQVPADRRDFTAVLNWSTSLLTALETKVPEVSNEEIGDAVATLKETLPYCETQELKAPLAEALQRLQPYQKA